MPGVYISYPFCSQKCSFCNFASGVYSKGLRASYRDALLREIRCHDWDWTPQTLYFGGGTPSLMPVEVFDAVMTALPGEKLAEATLECAPGTITADCVRAWGRRGINRVSLGVQSFVEAELRQVGRRHTTEIVAADVSRLRHAGIDNINIDLIAGLPHQTSASWAASLEWIERIAPPHVSIYIFEADEDSRLGKELVLGGSRYGANRVPDDELVAELYEQAVERLARAGLRRYEISNFAKCGFESAHNLKYWNFEPYIGFGLDAHSFDGRERWSNPDSLSNYLSSAPEIVRMQTDRAEEHFFIGLRLANGIEPSEQEWVRFAKPIQRWTDLGMLERHGSRLSLARRAVLVSNEILQDFVNA